jgi:hypothetical protein
VATRRQRRRRDHARRHAAAPGASLVGADGRIDEPTERLVYSREQAAHALGVSLATLDRRVVPAITTVKTEWGARLIPAGELERFLVERTEGPRKTRRQATPSGRRSSLPPEVVARILKEHARGASLAEIARDLNRDAVPTGQGGRQWWPSTVRTVLSRSAG